ncbi:hypothetical protein QFZ75_008031 [Streptomyces sp. V3I8]|uniref:hypothetical protein n=1 Tax=Streptomyces sp. V3I8 TaxID=3042279 RepID=UPI00277D63BF|nr:hypothetical protein [Streptomyces sp. V3I8]MDQ1041529.1 hypothetical protein [Streptomyces sp. V3I8]
MPARNRPVRDPAALESTAKALQDAAARLLAQGVPLEDVTALAEAARAHAAERAAETVAQLGRSIGVHSPSLLSTKPIDVVRTAPLPLLADAPQES